MHCKKCGVTEHPRGAIFSCFHGNSMGYHGNMKILVTTFFAVCTHEMIDPITWLPVPQVVICYSTCTPEVHTGNVPKARLSAWPLYSMASYTP